MTMPFRVLFLLWLACFSMAAHSIDLFGNSDEEFLPAEKAFSVRAEPSHGRLDIIFKPEPGYYLYQKKFNAKWAQAESNTPPLPTLEFVGQAEETNDPTFGQVVIYRDEVIVRLNAPAHDANGMAELSIGYQGCAEAGLCYPPQHWLTTVDLSQWRADPSAVAPASSAPNEAEINITTSTSADSLAAWLAGASLVTVLGVFFALGLGLSLTPCVLPMLPILSAIIAGQQQLTAQRGLALAFSYVMGMSLTYTAAGLLIAALGASANISAWMQQPSVLISFAAVFFVLAVVLWQGRDLRLPDALHNRLVKWQQHQSGGQWLSVFIMGAISSLVVSPCVSAPLAGTLLFISTTQDLVLGGSALFMLSLGMGVPLLLLGAGGGRWIPKAGAWMEAVKRVFAWLLAAVAWSLLMRLLSPADALMAWGGFLALSALMLAINASKLRIGLAIALLAYAGLLVAGGARGATSLLTPWQTPWLSPSSSQIAFDKITSVTELEARIAQAAASGQPLIVDLYADWCVSCIEMEQNVFVQPDVSAQLQQAVRLKLDITSTTGEHLQWMEKYQIVGPPAYLLWSADGQQQPTIVGARSAAEFLSALQAAWQ